MFSGVADLRKIFDAARGRRAAGQGTLLFVDEIHRFNRAQQDGFLPYVENGTVILVGATTENPSFELNGALLSRCQVFVLNRLDDAAMEQLIARAEPFPKSVNRENPSDLTVHTIGNPNMISESIGSRNTLCSIVLFLSHCSILNSASTLSALYFSSRVFLHDLPSK